MIKNNFWVLNLLLACLFASNVWADENPLAVVDRAGDLLLHRNGAVSVGWWSKQFYVPPPVDEITDEPPSAWSFKPVDTLDQLPLNEKVVQLNYRSLLTEQGGVYIWQFSKQCPSNEASILLSKDQRAKKCDFTRLSVIGMSLLAEEDASNIVMADSNGQVFYFDKQAYLDQLHQSPSSQAQQRFQQFLTPVFPASDDGVVALAVSAQDRYTTEELTRSKLLEDRVEQIKKHTDYYYHNLVVASRASKQIELASKTIYPLIADEFTRCRLPDTPDVVKRLSIEQSGIVALLENEQLIYRDFTCAKEGEISTPWQPLFIRQNDRFIDFDNDTLIGANQRLYSCDTSSFIPSSEQPRYTCELKKTTSTDNFHRVRGHLFIDKDGNYSVATAIGFSLFSLAPFIFVSPPKSLNQH